MRGVVPLEWHHRGMDSNEKRVLKVRVRGGEDDLDEAMERWREATAPMRDIAEKFAAVNMPKVDLPEGYSSLVASSLPPALDDLPDLPNPIAEQATRDRAMLDALLAIQSHLETAELEREAQRSWELAMRWAGIVGAVAALAAAIMSGIALP